MAAHVDAPLRVAFVGCGNISKYHVNALPLGRCVVTVVVDPVAAAAEAAAAALEVRTGLRPVAHASLAAALAADSGRFDACDVMVPCACMYDGGDLHEAVAVEVFVLSTECVCRGCICRSSVRVVFWDSSEMHTHGAGLRHLFLAVLPERRPSRRR